MDQPTADDGDSELRHRRIAERAYLKAAAREFHAGDPVSDWLAAEAEINALSVPSTPRARALRWHS